MLSHNKTNIFVVIIDKLSIAISNLLKNTNEEGTVVRWVTAMELGENLKLKTNNNKLLLSKIEIIAEGEMDKGVKNKFLDALKKTQK